MKKATLFGIAAAGALALALLALHPAHAHEPSAYPSLNVPAVIRHDNVCILDHENELHVDEDRLTHPLVIACDNGSFVIKEPSE